ncbi:vomeronasal type-2 receptor 26-like [Xenopus tropicalis]|uniref:Vomeronasal type-2 receptor 26-like n=1 Tax=Xenopus tropicalis TaxID=8364 RepID=A0A8J1IPX4_XENTR|nr:vomeronasal type-2 receptor 26-like [Xenopus tropicalis]
MMSTMDIRNTVMKAIAWPAVTWMLAALYCSSMKNPNSPACSLNVESAEGYLQEGDIMLGILLDIFSMGNTKRETFTKQPNKEFLSLLGSSLQQYRHFLAAIFAIEEINSNQNILPNVTLGFHIHDSWANERKATSSTFSMLTGSSDYVPNYKCTQNRIPSAFIGHLLSSVSNVMYQITSIYGFAQVWNVNNLNNRMAFCFWVDILIHTYL